MKTTLQALGLILFVVLFHFVVISSFGLVVWLGLTASAVCMFICWKLVNRMAAQIMLVSLQMVVIQIVWSFGKGLGYEG